MILNLFVDYFICYYFNYVLIIFLVCCIADRIMNISFQDFEDFSYMDDPFISGDKSFLKGDCFTGVVISFMSSIPCDGGIAMRLLKKRHVPLVVFLHVTLVRDRNLDY